MKVTFGQYYHTDSLVHRLDPRTKLVSIFLLMAFIFVIPRNDFIILGSFAILLFFVVFLTRVPLMRFLKSIRHVVYLLLFSFIFQAFFNRSGALLGQISQVLTVANISVAVLLLVLFFLFRRYLPIKSLWFLALVIFIIYMLQFPLIGTPLRKYELRIYQEGVVTGLFIILRILLLIILSSVLTLTTKPTDLNNGLEWVLKPLGIIRVPVGILSMMIAIALRFIPTLFLETDKILKAQASRGVDFREGKFKEKILQIISLLVPMFIISFKRAEDLADAMEARGYIPGAKRTRLTILRFKFLDIFVLSLTLAALAGVIFYRVVV